MYASCIVRLAQTALRSHPIRASIASRPWFVPHIRCQLEAASWWGWIDRWWSEIGKSGIQEFTATKYVIIQLLLPTGLYDYYLVGTAGALNLASCMRRRRSRPPQHQRQYM